MTDKMKIAFGAIRAEESLKENTLLYLRGEIQKRRAKDGGAFKRFSVAFACAAAVFLIVGIFAGGLYTAPSAYVDVDVNPSVALVLNRFDRVIGVHAYNEDGKHIVSQLSVMHHGYTDALAALLETIDQNGYIKNDGLVSVTLQADNAREEALLLSNVQRCIAGAVTKHQGEAQIDIFTVSADTRIQAYEHNLSPAKYLAIQDLMAVDPTASIEGCRRCSISEIQQQIQNCHMRSGRGGRHMGCRAG